MRVTYNSTIRFRELKVQSCFINPVFETCYLTDSSLFVSINYLRLPILSQKYLFLRRRNIITSPFCFNSKGAIKIHLSQKLTSDWRALATRAVDKFKARYGIWQVSSDNIVEIHDEGIFRLSLKELNLLITLVENFTPWER